LKVAGVADMNDDAEDLRTYLATKFAEMAGEFKAVRGEMAGGFKAVRGEMADGFKAVRGEMADGFKAVRGETDRGFSEVASNFADVREYLDTRIATAETRTQVLVEDVQANIGRLIDGHQAVTEGQEVLRGAVADLRTGQLCLEGQVAGLAAGQARLEKIVSPQ